MAHPSIFDPPVNGVVIPKGSAQAPTARRADPLTAIARQQRAAWIDPLDVDFTDRYKIGTPELEEARKIAATLRVRLKSELANPISSLILMKPPAQKEWLEKFYESLLPEQKKTLGITDVVAARAGGVVSFLNVMGNMASGGSKDFNVAMDQLSRISPLQLDPAQATAVIKEATLAQMEYDKNLKINGTNNLWYKLAFSSMDNIWKLISFQWGDITNQLDDHIVKDRQLNIHKHLAKTIQPAGDYWSTLATGIDANGKEYGPPLMWDDAHPAMASWKKAAEVNYPTVGKGVVDSFVESAQSGMGRSALAAGTGMLLGRQITNLALSTPNLIHSVFTTNAGITGINIASAARLQELAPAGTSKPGVKVARELVAEERAAAIKALNQKVSAIRATSWGNIKMTGWPRLGKAALFTPAFGTVWVLGEGTFNIARALFDPDVSASQALTVAKINAALVAPSLADFAGPAGIVVGIAAREGILSDAHAQQPEEIRKHLPTLMAPFLQPEMFAPAKRYPDYTHRDVKAAIESQKAGRELTLQERSIIGQIERWNASYISEYKNQFGKDPKDPKFILTQLTERYAKYAPDYFERMLANESFAMPQEISMHSDMPRAIISELVAKRQYVTNQEMLHQLAGSGPQLIKLQARLIEKGVAENDINRLIQAEYQRLKAIITEEQKIPEADRKKTALKSGTLYEPSPELQRILNTTKLELTTKDEFDKFRQIEQVAGRMMSGVIQIKDQVGLIESVFPDPQRVEKLSINDLSAMFKHNEHFREWFKANDSKKFETYDLLASRSRDVASNGYSFQIGKFSDGRDVSQEYLKHIRTPEGLASYRDAGHQAYQRVIEDDKLTSHFLTQKATKSGGSTFVVNRDGVYTLMALANVSDTDNAALKPFVDRAKKIVAQFPQLIALENPKGDQQYLTDIQRSIMGDINQFLIDIQAKGLTSKVEKTEVVPPAIKKMSFTADDVEGALALLKLDPSANVKAMQLAVHQPVSLAMARVEVALGNVTYGGEASLSGGGQQRPDATPAKKMVTRSVAVAVVTA